MFEFIRLLFTIKRKTPRGEQTIEEILDSGRSVSFIFKGKRYKITKM